MTRRSKRCRNKSSPQVASSPKKQRNQSIESVVEESEISDLSDLNTSPILETVDITKSSCEVTVTSAISASTSSYTSENSTVTVTGSTESTMATSMQTDPSDPSGQTQTPIQGPPHIDNSGLQSSQGNLTPQMQAFSQPLHYPSQPQMLDAGMFIQPNQPVNYPFLPSQQFRLSDEDILRLARQVQTFLKDEIEQLVEIKVALVTEPLKQEIACMKDVIDKLQSDMKAMITKNDELEQYSRRSCVRVSGIAEKPNEDVTQLVLDLADRISADINVPDIDRTHRVGKVQSDNTPGRKHAGREIIIKFTNYEARLRFLKGRAKLREQKVSVFINEDLTRTRKNLAFECRQLQKKKLIKKTWVYGGNVYIIDNTDSRLCVKSLEDLADFRVNG